MVLVKHETCLEYFRRRLSEGWKCISLERYNAVLFSPEGIKREIDLRNDVETLRPSAAGDLTELDIGGTTPAPTNWQSVDEAIADENTTYVFANIPGGGWLTDLYNLPAHAGSGTINKITLYFRVWSEWNAAVIKGCIKSNTTVTETVGKNAHADFGFQQWGTYNQEWALNPADTAAWEWADIDALQIGYSTVMDGELESRCTQVYVEVDYTPPYSPAIRSANMAAKMIAGKLI